jgi:hypothetical protein
MKRTITLVTLISAMLINVNSFAWNKNANPTDLQYGTTQISGTKGITEGGFFLHYTPYLPSKKYLFPKEVVTGTTTFTQADSELTDLRDVGKFGFGHGLEIGNMFRLVDSEPLAIGLKVTWFSFGASGFKANSNYSYITGFSGTISALKVGPYATYALNDQMAVDIFYQVTPTVNFGAITGVDPSTAEEYFLPLFGYGLTHQIGATYRFDILSVGVGYGLGNTKLTLDFEGETAEATFYGSHLIFMLGMKF